MSDNDFASSAGRVLARAALGPLGRAVLTDPKGWDPVVPSDMHTSKLPPVAADGTAECWRCNSRMAFAALDIVDQAYCCRPCGYKVAQANALVSTPADLENHKIGRSWTGTLIMLGVVMIAIGLCVMLYLIPPG